MVRRADPLGARSRTSYKPPAAACLSAAKQILSVEFTDLSLVPEELFSSISVCLWAQPLNITIFRSLFHHSKVASHLLWICQNLIFLVLQTMLTLDLRLLTRAYSFLTSLLSAGKKRWILYFIYAIAHLFLVSELQFPMGHNNGYTTFDFVDYFWLNLAARGDGANKALLQKWSNLRALTSG